MALDLTSAAKVRSFKGWKADSDPDDAWIEAAISAASARVEKSLRRKTLQEAVTERLDVTEGDVMFPLRNYPILESPAPVVKYDALRGFASGTSVNAAHYEIDYERGILYVDGLSLAPGIRVLEVGYTGGMATTTAAFRTAYPDIAEAVDMQIAFWWESRARLGQQSVAGPDGSITLTAPLDYLPVLDEAIKTHRRKIW